jgi:hypothetical protein
MVSYGAILRMSPVARETNCASNTTGAARASPEIRKPLYCGDLRAAAASTCRGSLSSLLHPGTRAHHSPRVFLPKAWPNASAVELPCNFRYPCPRSRGKQSNRSGVFPICNRCGGNTIVSPRSLLHHERLCCSLQAKWTPGRRSTRFGLRHTCCVLNNRLYDVCALCFFL